MTWQLTVDEIAKHWKLIQYGAILASGTTQTREYSLGLLKNLLTGNYQCWFFMNTDRKVKLMGITRINKDEGDIKYLIIEPVFGFLATYEEEQKEAFETILKFAKKLNIKSVIGNIANPRMAAIAERAGMKKTGERYEAKIGE